MRIALIGDVHANLPALEAVLADAAARDAEAVWNVGDFVGYGAFPDEVVRLLRQRATVSILGNYDRKVLRLPRKRDKWRKTKQPDKFRAFEWAYEHLSGESLEYLASLAGEQRLNLCGRRILVTHGSPASESEPLTDQTPQPRLEELAGLARADVVVCGHSHEPMCREAAGVLFVGTGSVGRPEGGDPRACYAVMDVAAGELAVEHLRVEYDATRAADAIRAAGLPEAFAQMTLQRDNYDGVAQAGRQQVLAAVKRLGDSCDVEQEHTAQVTKLALRLFDELAPLHGLGPTERFYLRCAAMLHDIGWVAGQKAHHKTALRLILRDEDVPFDRRVRRIVASVARYHRKALPSERHEHFAALDPADQQIVRILGGVLRVADGLDRTHTDVVTDVKCRIADVLTIRCVADGPAGAELWAARKKADLLGQALGLPVTLETT